MHIYAAAVYTNDYLSMSDEVGRRSKLTQNEKDKIATVNNILESYHYVNGQRYVDTMRHAKAKVFLDSGAFSAHTLGVTIDLPTYCEYIKRNIDILRVEDGAVMASVLDGIGDPLQTYRNQLCMEELGAKPLPCFHFGEDPRYLEFYVKNYSYITLGGMVGKSADALIAWLDPLWDKYLVDGSGRPKLKVHAFGITSFKIMERYPWYSVDSSSWIQSAAFGTIVTPKFGNISVSDKSPSRHKEGQHASNFTEVERETLYKYLEDNGFTYERLSTVYESRAAFNIWAYGIINATINASKSETFKLQTQGLFA